MNKKVLRWNFVFQYGFVLTNIFNSLLLLPLYLKNIEPGVLGLWLATGNILAWITMTDPGIGDVLQQKIAELKGKNLFSEIGRAIGSGFFASGIIFIISLAAGLLLYFFLGKILDKDISAYPQLQKAFLISILATALSLVSFTMTGINQGMHNSAHVAISSLLSNILFLVVNLLLLYMGYGVVSIAVANLIRSVFIIIFNLTSILNLLNKLHLKIWFEGKHFKSFIKIFSFTSLSRIVSGLSNNIDLIILARFIPPGMITLFEVNRRPIRITQSLIGRHSVALMPVVSHAKGVGNKNQITGLINTQFRFYYYAVLFICFLFWITYRDLLTAWVGPSQYAGDTITCLLLVSFFLFTTGYFMSNMGYALGDIKMNSLINVVRGILLCAASYFVAARWGIQGVLVALIAVSFVIDFFLFAYRVYKMGYLQLNLLRKTLSSWSVLIPSGLLLAWFCRLLLSRYLVAYPHLFRIIFSAGLFTLCFLTLLIITDTDLQNMLKKLRVRVTGKPA